MVQPELYGHEILNSTGGTSESEKQGGAETKAEREPGSLVGPPATQFFPHLLEGRILYTPNPQKRAHLGGTESRIANRAILRIAGLESPEIQKQEAKN